MLVGCGKYGKMSKFVRAQADDIKCHIHTLRRLSPECHMCHKIVTEMSQDCPAVSRDVADVSPDVTEMSRPSHIFVTRCHKLSQLSYQSRRVTECQYICQCKQVDISSAWGQPGECVQRVVSKILRRI